MESTLIVFQHTKYHRCYHNLHANHSINSVGVSQEASLESVDHLLQAI